MVERIGVSLDRKLLDEFDELINRRGWNNRSEAIRDLIRGALVEEEWEEEREDAVAAVVLVYDHHKPDLGHRLAEVQHEHHDAVVSTLHVHMDAHNCLEVVVLRGATQTVKKLGDAMVGARGVRHGRFVGTTTGKSLA